MSSKYLSINNPKDLLYHIDNHVQNENNKKKFGEVFTPMSLVNEMLDKLPVHVWTDPNLKWLDPCVGMGNFMIAVYLRLIESLTIIKDINKRKKHILENMLYMVELNKKNVYITKQIFDINNEYKLNIACSDSLTLNYVKRFKMDTFDIIVGNPPYNKNSIGTGNSIWQLFVEMSLERLLSKNGFLVFVHPSGWRKPQSEKTRMKKYFNLMTNINQMLYLEIHDTKDGLKTFGCGTRYDYYVIQCVKKFKKTKIKDETGKITNIDLSKYQWLPNSDINIINMLLAKDGEETLNILNDFSYSRLDKKMYRQQKQKYSNMN